MRFPSPVGSPWGSRLLEGRLQGLQLLFLAAKNWVPSGKRLHSELENHHAIHGEIHYFNGHFQ